MSRKPAEKDSRIGKRVRNAATGDIGVIVAVSGGVKVRLDKDGEEWVYYSHEWHDLDRVSHVVAPHLLSRLCYDVDRSMLEALGKHLLAWNDLHDEDHVRWNRGTLAHEGPRREQRAKILKTIKELLGEEGHDHDPPVKINRPGPAHSGSA